MSARVLCITDLFNDQNYISFIYKDRSSISSDIVHILLDHNMVICGISSSAISTLNLTADVIKSNSLNFTSLCKEFQGNNYKKFLQEKSIPTTYDSTKMNEFLEDNHLSGVKLSISCEMKEILLINKELVGYYIILKAPEEAQKTHINDYKDVELLEFQYNEHVNKYYQKSSLNNDMYILLNN